MGAVMRDGRIGSPVHAAPGRRHGRSIRAALVSIALLRLNKELITQSIWSISSVVRKHLVPKGRHRPRSRGQQ